MRHHRRERFALAVAALLLPTTLVAGPIGFVQTNLVSDGAAPAATTDSALKNPWGMAFGVSSPFRIADNRTGVATVYDGGGAIQGPAITIPPVPGSSTGTLGSPTGAVVNGAAATGRFSGDAMIVASQDGVIAGVQGGTSGIVRVDSFGDVFTGLAILNDRLYAADFASGRIDAFDSNYSPLSLSFVDPNLPAGYTPFNIQALGSSLYVTYALQGPGGTDALPGPGNGIVDEYDANGILARRLATAGQLNAPWGLALAPAGFGDFGGALLVGNAGNGEINAFDPLTGVFVGTLSKPDSTPIVIDGLRGLAFGNGAFGFDPDALYFTAGANLGANGLFGRLDPATDETTPVPEPATLLLAGCGLAAAAIRRRRIGDPRSRR